VNCWAILASPYGTKMWVTTSEPSGTVGVIWHDAGQTHGSVRGTHRHGVWELADAFKMIIIEEALVRRAVTSSD
jgi:hypothetical protein